MKRIALSVLVTLIFGIVSAQDCNCESNFEWVKKTFEENDAGFEYALSKKGERAYQDHNNRISEKIKNTENFTECGPILFEWLEFFRSGHIAIRLSEQTQNQSLPQNTFNQDFSDWEKLKIDLPKFEKYLKNKKEADFEGIWFTEPYKIGIKKQGNQYVGFIIESGVDTWTKEQVKLKINNNGENAVFYMRDHSSYEAKDVKLIGKNTLQIGMFNLKRVSPIFEDEKKFNDYFKLINAQSPYLEQLNETTLLFRIPSFRPNQKQAIDSVINVNKELILKTENLIIDIRNNGGGSDGSFNEILPLIYTNPIRTVGVEYRSTKLNNQRMLDFIDKPEYNFSEEDKKWAKNAYDKLEENLGKFVGLNQYNVNLTEFDTIYPYPKNVGIIINERNGSTSEQFLLSAKQSKKVKLFGTTTYGVLDISNMYFVDSPCQEFQLGYALSRSKRIPHFAIDEIGIQPDYFMDEDIPDYDWIEYVNEILN